MSRVTKQTARKDYTNFGITKGDIYFKWHVGWGKGSVRMSKSYPKPSQQTSAIYVPILEAGEALEGLFDGDGDPDPIDVITALEQITADADEVSSEYSSAADSSEGLGEQWQEKADRCDEISSQASEIAQQIQELIDDEEESNDAEDLNNQIREAAEEMDCQFDQ